MSKPPVPESTLRPTGHWLHVTGTDQALRISCRRCGGVWKGTVAPTTKCPKAPA